LTVSSALERGDHLNALEAGFDVVQRECSLFNANGCVSLNLQLL
jgi:hypothetical protein